MEGVVRIPCQLRKWGLINLKERSEAQKYEKMLLNNVQGYIMFLFRIRKKKHFKFSVFFLHTQSLSFQINQF